MRILLIEDDVILSDVLVRSLSEQHYVVDLAVDGRVGWEFAQSVDYDLILMDIELPKLNGIELCHQLRSNGCSTPILLITAKDASTERIRGLDAGADDYLTKPLDLAELQARLRALLRRTDGSRSPILEIGGLQLDPISCRVTFNGKLLNLTPKEYNLLELFLRNPSRVFSRGNIIEHLWTFDDPPQEESVKSHIKGLRQKLKAAGAVDWIENVYGLGYRLKEGLEHKAATVGTEANSTEAKPPETSAPFQFASADPVSSPASPLSTQYSQAMNDLWQRYQGVMTQRFEVLQQAAIELQTGRLSAESRQAAIEAAHKLAGVLGMFERDQGTVIARELEELLSNNAVFQPIQVDQIQSHVQTLSQILDLAEANPVQSDIQPDIQLTEPVLDSSDGLTATHAAVRILVVDDDPLFLAALHPLLEPWGFHVTGTNNPLQVEAALQSMTPDLLILDVEMPQMSGIDLCQTIRSDSRWWDIPILFLTAHRDIDTIQRVLAAGADDYVVKPIVGPELLTRITNRLERTRLLQTLSTKDPITGLANQPQSSRQIELLLQQTTGTSLCFIILYIEQLRHINIQYGHAVGNQVLQCCGRVLQSAFSGTKILGYWGNGEFTIVIPDLTKLDANDRLTSLLTTLKQQTFVTPEGDRIQVNCRWATAAYPEDGSGLRSLYQAACRAL